MLEYLYMLWKKKGEKNERKKHVFGKKEERGKVSKDYLELKCIISDWKYENIIKSYPMPYTFQHKVLDCINFMFELESGEEIYFHDTPLCAHNKIFPS